MMHPMNGMEFCRKVKQDEKTSHIPVIMLTSLSDSRHRIKGLETGADDYVSKPFSTQELFVRIRNLILQRKKLRELFSSTMNLEPKAISITSADEKFLRKLIRIIEDNIDNSELDLEFLLKNIAMSRSQLHRKITALTGQPITGFIRIIRIKRAAQLFEQKFGNVSDVMYAVGFTNLSYFTKSFREIYNTTPSEFMAK
jgi:DNA-binding response OmpR family regulator